MLKRTAIYAAPLILIASALFLYIQYDELFLFPKFRAVITDQLKDPASTQYRNEKMISNNWMCGELNSKNGNGGYVGFKRFIASNFGEAYLEGTRYLRPEDNSTNRAIIIIEEEIKLLEDLKSKSTKWSNFEMEQEVTKRLFDKKWKEICDM